MTTNIYMPSVNSVNDSGRPLLTNTAWHEWRVNLSGVAAGPIRPPDMDPMFGTDVPAWHFQWNAVNPEQLGFAIECSHQWKAGTAIYPHVHMALPNAGLSLGLENIQWQLDYLIANEDGVFPAGQTTINITTDVQDEPVRQHLEPTFAPIDMTGFIECTVIAGRIRRMVSIGNDYEHDVIGLFLDFYFEVEKFGTANRSAPYGN